MNIFEITKEHLELIDLLEQNEGEMTEEQEQAFLETLKKGEDKITALYHVFANKRADLGGLKFELDRIANIKKRVENEMGRIERLIEMYMRATGTDSIKKGVVDIIMAKKVNFEYRGDFPSEFITTETVSKERLADFKAWCKANPDDAEKLYGAKFIEDKAIRIK